jgi:formylglycine-generating enzyme required for sulfatase activity
VDDTHARVVRLEGLIEDLAQRNHIRPGDLGRLVVSINSAQEQELLRRVRDEYRQLPPEEQKASHLLLLGDSLNAAGLFALAQQSHTEAARRAAAEKQRAQEAEAAFKTYRSACEQGKWAEALPPLLHAAGLDPERFAPFPLKRYSVQGILGSGGFGTVFLCRDTRDEDELVAIKALHTADLGRSIQDIFREASTLKKLRDTAASPRREGDAIIGVRHWDFADAAETRPYIVMDYFPGLNLEEHLRRHGALDLPVGLPLLRQLAGGVRAAHRRGIWHRDLKPANVLVRQAGAGWELKIIDFGLAVQKEAASYSVSRPPERRSRQERSYAGTWDYAPPEQRGKSSEPVGPHSDVYSFGKTACETLLGTYDPRSWHFSKLPVPLAELLERCIAPAVQDRPPTFEEILPALDALIDEIDPAKPRQRQEAEQARQRAQAEAARRRLEEEQRQRPPNRWTSPTLNTPFVLVPAGTAWLGGEGGSPGTQQVSLPQAFYLGVYPVTQVQWQALMGGNPSYFAREGGGRDRVKAVSDTDLMHFPVEQVSWEDAQEFLKRLNEREKGSGWLYRLPTEVEWEYACRGGPGWKRLGATLDAAPGREPEGSAGGRNLLDRLCSGLVSGVVRPVLDWVFVSAPEEVSGFDFYFDKPTNDLSSDLANFDGNRPAGSARAGKYLQRTSRVGLYPGNALGLHDLHGNVWEWCDDAQGPDRVIRGGCWYDDASRCRAAFRLAYAPTFRYHDLGFRLARVPSSNKG